MVSAIVVYASMTGNTKEIAEIIDNNLVNNGIESEIFECTEITTKDLHDFDICIVATYTYGDGELPDEIVDFYNDLGNENLESKFFGVCGSGDKSYADLYCKAVDMFEKALLRTNAKKCANSLKIEFAPTKEDVHLIQLFCTSLVNNYEKYSK